jgi:hypothetical protein
MGYTRLYTLTVREVLRNLGILAIAYEKMSAGSSPTGNYYFAVDATETAATLKASQQLISQIPVWIPVSERLPEEDVDVLVMTNYGMHVADLDEDGLWNASHGDSWQFPEPTHWMPLPEPPEAK